MLKPLKIYYVLVSLPFVLLLLGSAIFFDAIKLTITRNPHPQINYTIFIIILVGGCLILLNARRLLREASNLLDFSAVLHSKADAPTLQKKANGYSGDIACLLQMVAASSGRSISHQEQVALEHELTNARARLLRRNALPQYLTGLLVGMGLLGTFIGLLATLNDISLLISSFAELDMQNASPLLVFRTMIERMKAPMSSMGIAFSASMYGLLGSIILGLMMVGLRRLQGDIFSLLSSEVSRHIEIALSYGSVTYRSGAEVSGEVGDVAKVLVRIEERMAEALRTSQRALSAEIEDFQEQRSEMLRALSEQTQANQGLRSELVQLGRQLGTLVSGMERGNREMSGQISDLTVHLSAGAKETHKLLGLQVEEQKNLRGALDAYKIEERLAEAARMQQRTLSALVEDFQNQRSDMQRTLDEQTEASNNFRIELQQIGRQLDGAFKKLESSGKEISTQISELTVLATADAKESHRLLAGTGTTLRSEMQQLAQKLCTTLEGTRREAEIQMERLAEQLAAAAGETQGHLGDMNRQFQVRLQELAGAMEKGSHELGALLNRLTDQMAAAAETSGEQLNAAGHRFRDEMQVLGEVLQKGKEEMSAQISGLREQLIAGSRDSNELFSSASLSFHDELQQLNRQLGTALDRGRDETCPHVSELLIQMAAASKESAESTAHQVEEALAEEKEVAGARD